MQDVSLTFGPDVGTERAYLPLGGDLSISVSYALDQPLERPALGVIVKDQLGTQVICEDSRYTRSFPDHAASRDGRVTSTFSPCPLTRGTYTVNLYFGDPYSDHDTVEDAVAFEVLFPDEPQLTAHPRGYQWGEFGVIAWPAQWSFVSGRHS
jgi:hypothetical protein